MGDALLIAIEKEKEFKHETSPYITQVAPSASYYYKMLKMPCTQRFLMCIHRCQSIVLSIRISNFVVGMTLVKNNDEKIIGIVTDSDIRKNIFDISQVKNSTARDYMIKGFISINQEARSGVTWKKMAAHNISNLVVLDDIEEVVGTIIIHNVLY